MTDRLVQLFLQSARPEGTGSDDIDDEGIARALEATEKMLSSEDAIKMAVGPDETFVLLAMSLEEKPKLERAAIACYEKALEYHHRRAARGRGGRGGWEECVILQQLGAVCLRQRRLSEADKWLADCSRLCTQLDSHPREAVLFGGNMNTEQTRLEFASNVERMRAKTCVELGDNQRAHMHVNEAKRLHAAVTGDAVERQASTSAPQAKIDPVKELWTAQPSEERQLTEYHFSDEGPTILLMLDLNQHLGIGEEASAVVECLQQFKVKCKDTSVDIQLRFRRRSGAICHCRLLLDPLAKEIVPEDTVPKLRGKDTKRRLEVKLFKRDKQQKWYGDLVTDKKVKPAEGSKQKTPAPAKGSILNPLTPEELAALPRPSDTQGDNRPSAFNQPKSCSISSQSQPRAGASDGYVGSASQDVIPAWVSKVDRRQDELDKLLLEIHISDSASDVSMKDMELNADAASHSLSLKLLRDDALCVSDRGGVLTLAVPSGADVTNLEARWRRKTRVLEIRLPTLD
eukprot:TRINITY_DN33258_c0_g1_i1.p1 TRINITY_DN33258_c0_g1~~TRINITY_DN33258_c0_g1_i1.p1  ORF type:complete len:515 (+),score=115.99 TRINITY_DN33258_c0_g1_i1:34-1578(+)